jgi:FkbM family methyltransferase
MNVLFVMRHSGYVRNFESTLRLLCDRGHTVHLAFQIAETHWLLDANDAAQALADRYPGFTRGVIPVREDSWAYLGRELRASLDYLRYLTPAYRRTPKLAARAAKEAPASVLEQTKRWPFTTAPGRALQGMWLRALHRAIPSDPRVEAFLEAHRPDVLVVTPLIEPGAPQAEYVRSARKLGIPTALCVASWDNLTNKGVIHGPVDLVAVWNDAMRQEAIALHGVPAERVVVTGAQPFDHWFEWRPDSSREAFCERIGLPGHEPYLFYVCSSRFVAPDEVSFVRAWLQQLRQAGSPALRRVGVLVRPHPQNADQWRDVDLDGLGPVVIWPRAGEAPADQASRAAYFDSIHHSAAVVGVNTTAEIESAIIGRRVFTVLAPEFHDTQEGTLHFDHLRSVSGGFLQVARALPEHLEQLDGAIRDPGAGLDRGRRFVEAFVRPNGMDVPATPRLVDALEGLAQRGTRTGVRPVIWASALRPALRRRAERLQHAALVVVEQKSMKALAKARRKKDAAGAQAAGGAAVEGPDVTSRPGQGQQGGSASALSSQPPRRHGSPTWRELVPGFRALSYEDRVRFGQATIDVLPSELLLEVAKPERLDYPDAEIHLRVLSKRERERLKACAKEPFTVDWIHRSVRAGDVLYDIGANVGAYSLVAAKKPGGAARVFAFEPSYANVSSLCANIVLNGAADAITPLAVALSGSSGLSVLGLRALEPGAARHTLGGGPSAEGPSLYEQPVLTFRLDDLVERLGLPLPNHIKLDVDGGELAVLEGAGRTLASPLLRSMLVEVNTSLSDAVTDVLSRHGLALRSRVLVKNKAGEYLVWYGLFGREPLDSSLTEVPELQFVSR